MIAISLGLCFSYDKRRKVAKSLIADPLGFESTHEMVSKHKPPPKLHDHTSEVNHCQQKWINGNNSASVWRVLMSLLSQNKGMKYQKKSKFHIPQLKNWTVTVVKLAVYWTYLYAFVSILAHVLTWQKNAKAFISESAEIAGNQNTQNGCGNQNEKELPILLVKTIYKLRVWLCDKLKIV